MADKGFNATSQNATHGLYFPADIQIGLTIFASLIFVVALVGNSIVVYIVCSCNHMRNTTNILIANMAVADLWITFDIPYVIKWFYITDTWFGGGFGDFLCKFCHSAQAGSVACSVFTLVCISLDRSFAIIFPMKVILTRKIVKFMILGIWAATIAFTTPIFLITKVHLKNGVYVCNELWEESGQSERHYIAVYTITTYIIPLALILIMYIFTGLKLWSRKPPGQRSLQAHKKIQSSTRRATIMLITVVVVFAVCWFPFQIRELLSVFYEDNINNMIPFRVMLFLPWFGFANSAINPILYVLFSENYRREFRRTFTTTGARRRSSTSISRGATLRTRMSLTGIPLQKLRNDSLAPNNSPCDGGDANCFRDSNSSNKMACVVGSVESDSPDAFEPENNLIGSNEN
ncbi:predicted protein [Nematostella vectensis]|uniref:G-protein coupled receptors family 1 profile domain-containing protein n=1 Tax=Nematostella vectensis TaxID=45351 RepID=A7SIX0_NEMVE|nr:RYamide receptor [Nematostella vectensis]XP_032232437.1 RYamide receptor [Nematostella vectensis]XP_032232438.1 RYamide receptor [Nematostella vectensis]XP_032232439.1 RYamide receptor [Nematostella vectensis]XP_032232440.1 RYamide receptor [Nematostella vectensis]XP_032232441.1 RYamide receptor [Nematostella vectensis]XP_048588684.1 RYamide receptor [Nematostella vectensis]EDO36377.1 predicted protein [Nematostella vectensis]|eukprot:XP_001628440.1 predicted protein [Nematostella vectensis]